MAAENLIDELLEDARERMVKSTESAQHEFSTVRTGRASPSLLDRVNTAVNGLTTTSPPTTTHREELARAEKDLGALLDLAVEIRVGDLGEVNHAITPHLEHCRYSSTCNPAAVGSLDVWVFH